MFRTKKEIQQKVQPMGKTYVVPKGTPVFPATNLPQGGYWVQAWHDEFDDQEASDLAIIGIHATDDEVEDCENGKLVLVDGKDFRVMNNLDIEEVISNGEAETVSVHGTNITYKKYSVPCSWQMYGHAEVVAINLSEAASIAESDSPLPDGSYVEGSFEVDYALIDDELEEEEYEED